MSFDDPSFKVVVVGDGHVGKTSMLIRYTSDEAPQPHIPTVLEKMKTTITTESGRQVHMNIWDTAGQEDYDRLRTMTYSDCHVFIICFSIARPASLGNVQVTWLPEVREHCQAPFLLVGTKLDLRDDPKTIAELERKSSSAGGSGSGSGPVTYAQGLAQAKQLGAAHYFECSAITREGLTEIFQKTAELALDPKGNKEKGKKKFKCAVL